MKTEPLLTGKLRLTVALLIALSICLPQGSTPALGYGLNARAPVGSHEGNSGSTDSPEFETYTEDFASYNYKAYTDQTSWDVFQQGLKLQSTSGGAHRYSAVTRDGAGGAFVVWQDLRNNRSDGNWDIYAQHVDSRGNRLWAADLRVNSDSTTKFQGYPSVEVDSEGNALVAWIDDREEPAAKAVYAQKISRSGDRLWSGDVRVNGASSYRVSWWPDCMDMAVDLQGNLVVVWQGVWDGNWNDPDLHAQKLSPTGQRLWPTDVQVNQDVGHRQTFLALDVAEQGDIVVAWIDERNGGEDVYSQRLAPNGQRRWPSDVKVSDGAGVRLQGNPSVAADSQNNAVIVWRKGPADPPLGTQTSSIVAQKISASGVLLWPANRQVNVDIGHVFRGHPRAAKAPNDQVLVLWEDTVRGFALGTIDVHAQLLRPDGIVAWASDQRVNPESWKNWNLKPQVQMVGDLAWVSWETDDSVYLQQFNTATAESILKWPSLVNESDGRIDQIDVDLATLIGNSQIVAWHEVSTHNWDIRIQKLDLDGTLVWPVGVLVNDATVRMKRQRLQIAANRDNNLLVVWQDEQGGIYGRLMSPYGVQLWGNDHRIDTHNRQSYHPAVAALGDGSFIVAWLERRNPDGDLWDVYLQRLDSNGDRLWPADVRVNSRDNHLSDVDVRSKPELAVDGQGHIVIVWRGDAGRGVDVIVRRFAPNGTADWNVERPLDAHLLELGGRFWERVFAAAASNTIMIAAASAQGGRYGLRLHRWDLSGNALWPGGVWIDSSDQETFYGNPSLAYAADGGVVASWDEEYGPRNVFAQRVNLSGQSMWPDKAQLNELLAWPLHPALSSLASGSFVVAWNDERYGDNSIYARRFDLNGALLWDRDLVVTPDESFYVRNGVAESVTIDGTPNAVEQVSLLPSQSLNGGQITYSLTNNGGLTWEEATPGQIHRFAASGSDLRWKAVLVASPDTRETPVIHRLTLRYGPDVVGDAFEPDGTCSQAFSIPVDGTAQQHAFYRQADVDWIQFDALMGARYLIEVQPPLGSPADVALEVHGPCGGQVLDYQNHTFSPGIRLLFSAPYTGPIHLRIVNHQPEVFGPHVAFAVSVRALATQGTPGALILVAGRLRSNDPLQANIHHVSDAVYNLYRNHGYPDDRIRYLATESRPGVAAMPTVENLRVAITSWALDKVGLQRPLTVYLIDHGARNVIYLDGPSQEWVTPDQLNGWLAQLEADHPDVKINIIVEACYSGSFIGMPQTVSRHGRLVASSTSASDLAWASTQGAVFSDQFLASLSQDATVYHAFQAAQAAVGGTGNQQEPWLDADGDGIANEAEDMAEAALRGFSYPGTFLDQWPPYVVPLQQPILINAGTGVLRVEVRDDTHVDRVWALIYAPSYQPPVSQDELVWEQITSVNLFLAGYGWYQALYSGFNEPGRHRIVFYAEDNEDLQARPLEVFASNGGRVFLPAIWRQ